VLDKLAATENALESAAADVERLERENAELREKVDWHQQQEAGLRDDIPDLESERDAALAVIEQVREFHATIRHQWAYDDLGDILATSPAEALNAVKAEAKAEALKRAIIAHRDLHPTYGSTAVCYGGVGGQAITAHCAELCHNPAHGGAKTAWEAIEAEYFAAIRAASDTEGNDHD
jgi:hypothetical protein